MRYQEQAKALCNALKAMTNNEYSIENFESYLSYHFDTWLRMYANTPDDMTAEIQHFANITE